jgi:hypothetical protein
MGYFDGYVEGYGPPETFPTVGVEIAFATTPFVTPTWTDVSDFVMSGDVTRGRTTELDKIRAGQCSLVLSNEDRRFDPTHTAGPYWPNVLPMRRLRIRATYDTVTYDVFNGYIDRWEQQYEHPQVAYAIVTATDAFKVLAAKDLPSSAYATEVLADGPAYWWRLGEAASAFTARDSIQGATAHLVGAGTFGASSLISRESDGAFECADTADSGLSYPFPVVTGTDPDFTIEFVMRATDPTPAGQWQFSIGTSGGADLEVRFHDGGTQLDARVFTVGGTPYTSSETYAVGDGLIHHVAAVVEGGTSLQLYVDGTATGAATTIPTLTWAPSGMTSIGNNTGFGFGLIGVLDEVAVYDQALSAARVAAHAAQVATPWNGDTSGERVERILDTIGWPAADTTIDEGDSIFSSAQLSGSVLSYLQQAEASEGGLLFVTKDGKIRFRSRHNGFNLDSQATFGDDDDDLEYVDIAFDYSEGLIYNEIRISRSEGVPQVAEDATSQANYGERTYTSDGLLLASDTEARDRAEFLLAKYRMPVFRTTRMVVQPAGLPDATVLYPQVLGREIGEKITVRRKPQNVGAWIDQDVIVEGMKHDFQSRFWSTEFMLSPSVASSTDGSGGDEYLQLDDTDGPGLGFVRLAH